MAKSLKRGLVRRRRRDTVTDKYPACWFCMKPVTYDGLDVSVGSGIAHRECVLPRSNKPLSN